MKNVENKLCEIHNKQYAHLVGNATIGLYLILSALGVCKKKIAIPNNICFNVPLAILFSDNIPVFIDISLEDFGLPVDALKRRSNDFQIVLANHSYGSVCKIEEIKKYCHDNDKFLIEDFAMAQGARFNGIPVGSFGNVSLVSFGAGKIISHGYGGAVLSDDISIINEIKNIEKKFPPYEEINGRSIESLSSNFKNIYNQYYGTEEWAQMINFYDIAKKYKNSFSFRFSSNMADGLLEKIDNLQSNINERKSKAEYLKDLFLSESIRGIRLHEPPVGSVFWRFNILVNENRNYLLKHLLQKKIPVSSWYPSMNILFSQAIEGTSFEETPNSNSLSDTILNIWVNDEVNYDYLKSIVNEIRIIKTNAA